MSHNKSIKDGKCPEVVHSDFEHLKGGLECKKNNEWRVQVVTSPYIPTEAYRQGYELINWSNNKRKML